VENAMIPVAIPMVDWIDREKISGPSGSCRQPSLSVICSSD
jgi:hypothetical protein